MQRRTVSLIEEVKKIESTAKACHMAVGIFNECSSKYATRCCGSTDGIEDSSDTDAIYRAVA